MFFHVCDFNFFAPMYGFRGVLTRPELENLTKPPNVNLIPAQTEALVY